MDHMMMEGPMILGFNLVVFLMLLSGVVYIISAFFLWKPMRQEKNELITALFAFLAYQAISMIFMGIEMHTMQMVYSNIASLAVFIGSVYMLKFPFSSFSSKTRNILFYSSLIVVLAVFVWFIQTPERQMTLMHFTLWYDIVINGLIVGGSIIYLGLSAGERWLKVKAFGGGTGVVSCCVVANATMLGGAMLTSSVFQFLAPVFIIWTLVYARRKQAQQTVPVTPASIPATN